jgi:hypothetical protein
MTAPMPRIETGSPAIPIGTAGGTASSPSCHSRGCGPPVSNPSREDPRLLRALDRPRPVELPSAERRATYVPAPDGAEVSHRRQRFSRPSKAETRLASGSVSHHRLARIEFHKMLIYISLPDSHRSRDTTHQTIPQRGRRTPAGFPIAP